MTPLIAIGALAAGLLLVCLVLRINAIFMFVAFATGELLLHYLASDAAVAVGGFIKNPRADVFAALFLLGAPIVLCILFLRKSLPAAGVLLHIVPLAFIAAATALTALGILSKSYQQSFYSSPIGIIVHNAQNLIIVGSGVATLLLIFIIGRPRNEEAKSKHHGKHH